MSWLSGFTHNIYGLLSMRAPTNTQGRFSLVSCPLHNPHSPSTIHISGKQAVEVLVDADEGKVKALLKAIKERKPEDARVDDVGVEDYQGHVMRTSRITDT
ncbi:MAG: acylphosphatase [Methermicoccaceae archaeon]